MSNTDGVETVNLLEKVGSVQNEITAFIAVRLLQLRGLVPTRNAAKDINCQEFFSSLEWKLLWAKTEKSIT